MQRGVDYIGVGVGAAIFDDTGRLFLTLRVPVAKNERGRWEIPGGSVEFGETLAAAITREMREEHGVTIAIDGLLGVCDHILPDEGQHWVSPTYLCRIVEGEPTICEPEKCAAIGWFTLAEAKTLQLSVVTQHDLRLLEARHTDGGVNPTRL